MKYLCYIHIGPPCYVQPPVKSNKKIICNALSYTCLAGVVNNKARQEVVGVCVFTNVCPVYKVLFCTYR